METVNLIFGKSNSLCINYNRVGLVAGDYVYESVLGGFVKSPLHQFKSRYNGRWEIAEVFCLSKDLCYTRAKSLVGVNYPKFLIWQPAVKYSKQLAYCLGWPRQEELNKISPQYLWLASKTLHKGKLK